MSAKTEARYDVIQHDRLDVTMFQDGRRMSFKMAQRILRHPKWPMGYDVRGTK